MDQLKTSAESNIMTPHIRQYLRSMIPDIYQFKTWDRVFDISHDGVSSITFFHLAASYCPTIVLIEDAKKNIFGIYASQPWKNCDRFYGNGETFIFTFKV